MNNPIDLNLLAQRIHTGNHKWWHDMGTGAPLKRNKGELLALIHSEISECYDGESAHLMDDKISHRKMGEVELVDAIIRIFDYAGGFGYDLYQAGLPFGVSKFLDLNHMLGCCNVPGFVRQSIINGGLSVIHSQISKVLEHERRDRCDEVPGALVSCLLYISIYAGRKGYDLQGAFDDKMAYNATRKDHTHEARKLQNGKKF